MVTLRTPFSKSYRRGALDIAKGDDLGEKTPGLMESLVNGRMACQNVAIFETSSKVPSRAKRGVGPLAEPLDTTWVPRWHHSLQLL
jgi:hypothetical protein